MSGPSSSARTRLSFVLMATLFVVACGNDDDGPVVSGDPQPPAVVGTKDLYVFGDSLSDAGNLGEPLTVGADLPAPFYNNRISNGPVIVDYIAQSIGQTLEPSNYLSPDERGRNYAVAGAKANGNSGDLDLAGEIRSFLGKNDGQADPADLFVISIGGNDILDVMDRPDAAARLDLAVDAIGNAVQSLASRGARRFIVMNSLDVGRTPKIIAEETSIAPGRVAQATANTNYFNAALQRKTDALAAPGLAITLVDAYSILDDVIVRANALGFANARQGCYITDSFRFADYCSDEQLDLFVFFDSIHPSGRTHRLVAEEILRRITPVLAAGQP